MIQKEKWQRCYICNQSLSDIKKLFGGSNVYNFQAMKDHILKHGISLEDYFSKIDYRPNCECGTCNQKCNICTKQDGKTGFFWKRYVCGRNSGMIKWSNEAKNTRKGSGNPMYGKKPWNQGETKFTNKLLESVSKKHTGKIVSEETKQKQSNSAKKRLVHGHSGILHTEESKEKMRIATLKRIKAGDFKQTKTKPHIELSSILKELNIKYEEEKILDKWCFDFYIINYDLYIEADGDYFHSNPKIYKNGPITKTQKINSYRDEKKNKFVKDNNIKLIRFWESDILSNKDFIKEEILKYAF